MIDAHVHVFPKIDGYGPKGRTKSLDYGKVDQGDGVVEQVFPPLCKNTGHTYQTLLCSMDWAGVEKAVVLQNPCYGDWSSYVQDVCRRFPNRLLASAFFDPWRPDAKQYYDKNISPLTWPIVKLECSQASGLCGVYPGIRIYDDIVWVYEKIYAEHRLVTFDLGAPGAFSYQTKQIEALNDAFPNLKIVICHLGQPSPEMEKNSELFLAWEKQVSLARRANIWFDYSALPSHFPEERYPFPSTKRYLKMALDLVGPDKLMWGTDVPWLLGIATYKQFAELAIEQVSNLPLDWQNKLLSENARKVYWGK